MEVPILETTRLRLRPYRVSDRERVFELYGDPQVARFWSFPAWTDLAQAEAYLEPLVAPLGDDATAFPWAIADGTTDELVGTATLFAVRSDQQRAEIGYSLRASCWNKGYAREAVHRVLVHAFGDLALRRLEADVDPRNAASLALLESLGFVREGYLRERWNVAGEICDSVVYGLLARELRAPTGPRL
jgi:RimJ/RimL family protein N-acetyltransferase